MIALSPPGTHRATAAGWPRGLRPVGERSSQQPARVASGGLDRPDCGPPVVVASSGARGWEGERPLGGWLASSVRRRAERALSCFATLSAQSHYIIIILGGVVGRAVRLSGM